VAVLEAVVEVAVLVVAVVEQEEDRSIAATVEVVAEEEGAVEVEEVETEEEGTNFKPAESTNLRINLSL
jgi:hypothetical protein